jgi:imidazoleglycerol-phosphate dehydratase/histidinol-phosphatase
MTEKKKVLFIDRDGTLILEPQDNYQVDRLDKLEFYPGVFQWLGRIAREMDFILVMVTNQDGLGSEIFPEEQFWPAQNQMLRFFENEGIVFDEICIDRSMPEQMAPTRKPGTAMLTQYLNGEYDLENSYVIGDRWTDVELARNLGAKAVFLETSGDIGEEELNTKKTELMSSIALQTSSWQRIYELLRMGERVAVVQRKTNETNVQIHLDLDGSGSGRIRTGLGFFDHMLEQIARHSGVDLTLEVKGDLEVDEHHTIEDTALALGQAFREALGSKVGIERYGYCLPMDDCLAQVALDFGGRNWLVWKADFQREYIGKLPTEMFFHFFKSFTDGAVCNLNIQAEGENEHHKIEAIFKGLARAIKMAIKRDVNQLQLPSTKGLL